MIPWVHSFIGAKNRKAQIMAGDVPQEFMDHRFVFGTDRAHKDRPAVLDLKVPLPYGRIMAAPFELAGPSPELSVL